MSGAKQPLLGSSSKWLHAKDAPRSGMAARNERKRKKEIASSCFGYDFFRALSFFSANLQFALIIVRCGGRPRRKGTNWPVLLLNSKPANSLCPRPGSSPRRVGRNRTGMAARNERRRKEEIASSCLAMISFVLCRSFRPISSLLYQNTWAGHEACSLCCPFRMDGLPIASCDRADHR
jgi:hypothetical protein